MLGSNDPLEDALEHILEKVQNLLHDLIVGELHDLIVNLTEDGHLGR